MNSIFMAATCGPNLKPLLEYKGLNITCDCPLIGLIKPCVTLSLRAHTCFRTTASLTPSTRVSVYHMMNSW